MVLLRFSLLYSDTLANLEVGSNRESMIVFASPSSFADLIMISPLTFAMAYTSSNRTPDLEEINTSLFTKSVRNVTYDDGQSCFASSSKKYFEFPLLSTNIIGNFPLGT